MTVLLSAAMAGAQVAGPLTPMFGNLVATPREQAPTHPEAVFSEDLQQDGSAESVVRVAAPSRPYRAAYGAAGISKNL